MCKKNEKHMKVRACIACICANVKATFYCLVDHHGTNLNTLFIQSRTMHQILLNYSNKYSVKVSVELHLLITFQMSVSDKFSFLTSCFILITDALMTPL